MKKVWLIRHGESAANAGLPTTDPASVPLTDKGCKQAESVLGYFKDRPTPDVVVVSKYIRTHQTAEPTLKHFGLEAEENELCHEFTFLDPSKYKGTTVADRWPMAQAYIDRGDPDYRDGGDAESFNDFKGRAEDFLQWCGDRPEFIVVFSHERFIRACCQLIKGDEMSIASFFDGIKLPNCSAVALDRRKSGFVINGL